MGVQRMAGHAPFWLKLCTHVLVTVDTVKPWYNERLRDWQAMFTITRCFSWYFTITGEKIIIVQVINMEDFVKEVTI